MENIGIETALWTETVTTPVADEAVKQPQPEAAPEKPVEQPKAEEPKETKPEVTTPEAVVTKEQESEIKANVAEEVTQKKENLTEEIQEAVDNWDEIEPLLKSLFDDLQKKSYESIKATTEAEFYKKELDEARQELNRMKYDDAKIAVEEDDRPYLLLAKQYRDNPTDLALQRRYLQRTYERIEKVTWMDHSDKLQKFYDESDRVINNLSTPNQWADLYKKEEPTKAKPKWYTVPNPRTFN